MKKTRISHFYWILATVLTLFSTAKAAPATLTQSVTYNSETITMQLNKENLRGGNFEVWSQNASGAYDVLTVVDERSYIGKVDEYPGAVSCGILLDNGTFKGAVYFDRGVSWFTEGTSVVSTRGTGYDTFSDFQYPSAPSVGAGQAGTTTYGFELGIDADHNYYTNAGSDVATVLESIEYSVCAVRAIYMRDTLLRPYLGRILIRATLAHDPYTGLNQGNYLDAVKTEWNTNHTTTNPDLVAGVSPTKIGGGLAWVGVVGSASKYSVNQAGSNGNFDVVFRHEMGHNWGCGHFIGGSPEGTGIMGGNAPGRFSGCEVYKILAHRDNRIAAGGILDPESIYTATELPPYASLDTAEFTQTVDASITLNVLANDHDANGQALSLVSFDSVSANGGTVTQQGQDLVYVAQGSFLGTDYFTYKITDTTGKTATGVAIISVLPNDPLRAYVALDETSGTSAADFSPFNDPVTLSGTDFATATVPGKFGNAINLDGVDDHLTVSGVRLNSNTATLTAWVKQGATQNTWAGIIFDRSNGAGGLNMGNSGELRYHWNSTNWDWNSGLVPPADTWTFVALVIEPDKATMYMNSGSGFQTAVNNTSHALQSFGTTYIGYDPNSSPRHFLGAIDDARIYDQAMSQAELQSVFDGGSAEAPSPFDGATGVSSPVLSWASSAAANSYQIYVGTSQTAVANATTASPEYQGSVTNPVFAASLADQTQYFWRVDTVTPTTTSTGSVWSFTTGTVPPSAVPIAHWKLDESGGSTAVDSSGNGYDGTNSNVTVNQPGQFDQAYAFNGDTSRVTIPVDTMNISSNTMTVTGWIRADASQDDWISLLLNQGSSSRSGLVLRNNRELRYMWNNGSFWGWGSGLIVPADQWVFVALAIEPTKATIYMHDGATLQSASNSTTHNNEPFNDEILLGTDQGLSSRTFAGLMDDVRIYDETLEAWEVEAVYAGETPSSNQAPVANEATFAVAEDSAVGTSVGTVIASDPDVGDTLSYAITGGNTGGAFSIDSSGNITTATALDYETISSYSLTVTVTDSGSLSDTATVTVNVTDVAEGSTQVFTNTTPVAISASGTPTITSNLTVGGMNGTISDVDVKLNITHTWDADLQPTLIAPDGTRILLFASVGGSDDNFTDTVLDDEAGQSISAGSAPFTGSYTPEEALSGLNGRNPNGVWTLEIKDTANNDGGTLDNWSLTITTDISGNSVPTANDATFAVAEDSAVGTSVGTVSASDPDAGDILSYAITGGNTGGAFSIDNSGNITTATVLDYETISSYSLTVTVTDSGSLSDTATVTVNVTDVVEVTAPAVATGGSSNITQTTADIGFTVSDDGGEAPTVTIYWGESDGGNTPGSWSNSSSAGTRPEGSHASSITGLTEGTQYYYTVRAVNSAGESWGSKGSFTTEADTSPKLVRTTVSAVGNDSWTSVDLGQNYNSAVIVATPIYPDSNVVPVVTRIRNVSGSGFEVKIDRADGLAGAVTCDVSVIAVEEGVYTLANDGVTMEAVKFISTVTGDKNSWVAESRSYQNSYTSPVVVGQVMSHNDIDWSTFSCWGSSRTSPPSSSALSICKSVCEDPDTTRADETIGYIVIESGNGTLNGVNYSAGVGGDTVRGTGNTSSGYNYSLSGLSSASAAAVSLAGLDGGDGGWAVLYGANPFTSSQLTLAIDEDQLANSERNHTTEQVGYLVFE